MEQQGNQDVLDMIENHFGEFVEQLKKQRGYSLKDISDKTNLSPSYIYRLIKNFRGGELTTKLNILINGFGMENLAEEYMKQVLQNKEQLKKITD
ncbi:MULTISPECIES: helix-turn-helix domain-containing protein [Bacillaceae]|uniref:helix-turn-helix domain-containing protein n=1 Tax=Bacillaceae TaxID=186817 RepID=UPI00203ED659|nr:MULTISPECIES: helix-turn-helix domain-containing protein [Bacillaceae]MCM3570497.1 helix-turn-helix domain containing protein [Neobacillus mesonae]MCP1156604.1 helix-turn-helix domain containing protein [Bacillus infantis]